MKVYHRNSPYPFYIVTVSYHISRAPYAFPNQGLGGGYGLKRVGGQGISRDTLGTYVL